MGEVVGMEGGFSSWADHKSLCESWSETEAFRGVYSPGPALRDPIVFPWLG